MQCFVSTLANKKGAIRDEMLRSKDRSRKTMEQLRRGRAMTASNSENSAENG